VLKLGILSDTHDNVPQVRKAVALFNREMVDLVLHAGDYVAPFSVKPLFELQCDFMGVWGNNDGDKMALHRISQGKIEQTFRQEEYDGKKILLGHYFETLDALVASQAYSLIVYGHTHEPEMRKQGQTLVLNPGECGAWLYGESTVAVVDLDSLEGEIVTLP